MIIDILDNDRDEDGTIDPTTVVITTPPENGTVDVDPTTGKVTYTPNPGFSGQDTFEYTVQDNDEQPSNPAKVVIDVSATGNANETVKEADLRDASTPAIVKGEISLDNPGNEAVTDLAIALPTAQITSGGEPVIWEQTSAETVVAKTASGQEIMTVSLGMPVNNNGKTTVPYEIELKGPVDHIQPGQEDRLDLEFAITSSVADSNLIVTIEDDAATSITANATVGSENTFYANVVISLDFSSSMGGRDSGVIDPETGATKTRYEVAVDAIETMLDQYQERLDSVAPGKGDVKVNFSGFSKWATAIGLPDQNETWVSLSDAQKIVDGLRDESLRPAWQTIGVDTNYDAALQQVVHSYLHNQGAGPVQANGAHVDNTFFFVSDGIPNVSNAPDGKLGIQETSPDNYQAGYEYSDIGEDKWTEFLKEQNMKAIAVGIGPKMDLGESFLKPIAYDGQTGTNPDSPDDVIVLVDMSDLGSILAGLVPEATVIQGSISHDTHGNPVSYFGADGASEFIINVDGESYSYDYATQEITSTSTSTWQDAGHGVLVVETGIGSTLTLHMSENYFGEFSYSPVQTRPSGQTHETFEFTLLDKDGDRSSSDLVIDIQAIPEAGTYGKSRSVLNMDDQFNDLDVFNANAAENTLDAFANLPNAAEPVSSNNFNLSQHLDQLSAEQPNLI